jgi:hypothetical protein
MIELLSNTRIYSNIIKIANGNIYKSIVLYTIFNYDFIIIDYLYGFIHYMCDSVFFIEFHLPVRKVNNHIWLNNTINKYEYY